MNYSQVLEQQAALWRFVNSGGGFAGMTVAGMTHRGVTEAQAKAVIWGATMQTLKSGSPFYWDATTCDLVQATAPDVPDMTLRPEDVITPFGFCWFARPLPLTTPGFVGQDLPLLGYAWGEVPGQGIMLIPFTPSPKRLSGAPSQVLMWAYGDSFEGLAKEVRRLATERQGLTESEGNVLRRIEQMRYIAACTAFMNQRILVRSNHLAARSTRRRLERDTWEHNPEIQVITLRRAHAAAQHDASGVPVEWSCQWVVTGHWRQQACGPDLTERRPVFVLPYIKGPAGLPLKAPAQRVFAVVR